ncbi:MAG: PHP domain-containing protein [Anaerolineae bacterium]|nr:PHP domain-containing protein [Anaerolineae bacterium]MDW8100265.1 PHP domain-containing protein [Anaerolineae bacterium]
MTRLWRVDLHCHTWFSWDGLSSPEAVVAMARRRGLDRLAITDHNTIAGAQAAQQLAPDLIIVGEEVSTDRGELLAYYVQEEIPAGLPLHEALCRLRAQGCVISVSHPLDRYRRGSAMGRETLLQIIHQVDAIEVFNSRCLCSADNQRAAEVAREFGLPGTAGSDAHSAMEVGRSCLELPPFYDAEGFRRSLKEARLIGRLSSPGVHAYSLYARWRNDLRARHILP